MISQVYPHLSEEDAVDRIIEKMRPDINKGLPLDRIDTIEDLVRFARIVESRERQIENRTKGQHVGQHSRPRFSARDSRNQPFEAQETDGSDKLTILSDKDRVQQSHQSKSQVKRYRCDRIGHIGKECMATKTVDGKPVRLPKKPAQEQVHRIESNEVSKLHLNAAATYVDKIHSINEGKSGGQKVSKFLLSKKIKCNGIELIGLVDTGTFHTILDESVARENNWEIEGPAPRLGSAGNNPLDCVGTCKLEIEVTFNKRTRAASIHVAVVRNLGIRLLIGYKSLSISRLLVDPDDDQLSFKKASLVRNTKSGIRNREKLTLAPRTQDIIEATIPTVGTVLTIPNTLDRVLG